MARVTGLWRYPIKSHGREAIETVDLVAGRAMPWDRRWAVVHAQTKFDPAKPEWVMCRNFMIGNLTPRLAGLWAQLDVTTKTIALRHIELGEISFSPDDPADVARFLAWVATLSADTSQVPTALITLPDRGLTDTDYPSVSLMNRASHDAVADLLGRPIEMERWRGNIWLNDLPAWEEMTWFGRELRIGDAILRVREAVKRCNHPSTNPMTGLRDMDLRNTLQQGWGHQDFGVYAEVIQGGAIRFGDTCEVN